MLGMEHSCCSHCQPGLTYSSTIELFCFCMEQTYSSHGQLRSWQIHVWTRYIVSICMFFIASDGVNEFLVIINFVGHEVRQIHADVYSALCLWHPLHSSQHMTAFR